MVLSSQHDSRVVEICNREKDRQRLRYLTQRDKQILRRAEQERFLNRRQADLNLQIPQKHRLELHRRVRLELLRIECRLE